MKRHTTVIGFVFMAVLAFTRGVLATPTEAVGVGSNSNPEVTNVDVRIVARARVILNSPAKWNRRDTRVCPEGATTFSMYCALEKATKDVVGNFHHRGAAMQQARFVIDAMVPNNAYPHRLMGFNNDPKTTFATVQRFFVLLQERVARLAAGDHITPH